MKGWFFYISIIFLICLTPNLINADEVLAINITESGKVISYYDEYWVVNVDGVLTINNPFNTSFDFIQLEYNLGSLTIIEDNNTDFVKPYKIYIPSIYPNSQVSFKYKIRGITPTDPMFNNNTVLRNAIGANTKLSAFLITNIKKAEVENQSIDTDMFKKVKGRRLVVVTLENPTELYQNVTSITVIKTPSQDPNVELKKWEYPESTNPIIISPHSSWKQDIIDDNSTEGEVYWLSSEVIPDTRPYIIDDHFIRRFTEEDLYNVDNDSIDELETFEEITKYLEHLVYIKKTVSDTRLMPGDIVNIQVKVNNFAPIGRVINVTEQIPLGFSIIDFGGANFSSENKIFWTRKVNPDSTALIYYSLKYDDNDSLGLDYFEPTLLSYENVTLYSERIPFVRKYIPEKKIFIQKMIRYSVADEIVVQIQIQNLGEASIKDIYLKEFLSANDVFREISVQPEDKGRWKIPIIEKGQIWEVTYVTNENEAVNLLPEVYGVEKQSVLKTLIFENVVRNNWVLPTIKFIEIIAPLFILGFIIFMFVYYRRVQTKKYRTLKILGKDINKLKRDTELRTNDSIDILKRESNVKKDLPDITGFDMPNQPDVKTDRHPLREQAHINIENLKELDEKTKLKNQEKK